MRRFVEEITVRTPEIAEKIITSLETKSDDKRDPVYEVELYETAYDPMERERGRSGKCGCLLKIFIKEDVTSTDTPIGF